MKVNISIDCDPYSPRPNIHFDHIWKDILGKTENAPAPNSAFFGCWTWKNIEIEDDKKDEIINYLNQLYDEDRIRYFEVG